MDNNIVSTVFDSLYSDTTRISKMTAEWNDVNEKIKEGRYSALTLKNEMYPLRDELRMKIRNASESAISKAKGYVNQYRKDIARNNDLNPSEITEDVKLLQPGMPLTYEDIIAIINRNNNNKTMTQLALRFAKENGIDMKGITYSGGSAEYENADHLDEIINMYSNWIEKENAHEMLRNFFGR